MHGIEDRSWSLCTCSTHANTMLLYLPTPVRVARRGMVPFWCFPNKHSSRWCLAAVRTLEDLKRGWLKQLLE
jgi:hypothetical protein